MAKTKPNLTRGLPVQGLSITDREIRAILYVLLDPNLCPRCGNPLKPLGPTGRTHESKTCKGNLFLDGAIIRGGTG